MTKTRVTVPLLLAVLAVGAAATRANSQTPGAYPTTTSPAYTVASTNPAYQPTAYQQPAYQQASYPQTAYQPVTQPQPAYQPTTYPQMAAQTAPQAPTPQYTAWQPSTYGSYVPATQQQVACYSSPCAAAPADASGCGCDNPYMQPADGQSCMPSCDTSCMPCAPCAMWSIEAGGLLMSIDNGRHYTFSYDNDNIDQQYTDWHNVDMNWMGGFEVGLRRYGACSCSGWELLYWGLYPGTDTTTTYGTDFAGDLNPILNFGALNIGATAASAYTNDAVYHRLSRDVEVHNAEINYLMMTAGSCNSCCTPWRSEVMCGFRFLKYDDDLQFMAVTTNEPLYYDMDTENTLCGFQIGGYGEYGFGSRWAVGAGAKLGVFNNHIKSYNRIGTASTTATIGGSGPNAGQPWLVDASKDDVSFLGEFNLDLVCQITQCWYGSLGYRVVGVTGVASPPDQIYPNLEGINDVELVDSHGSLFLHGFTVSVERRF